MELSDVEFKFESGSNIAEGLALGAPDLGGKEGPGALNPLIAVAVLVTVAMEVDVVE